MAQPIWITPVGNIGTFPSNIPTSYQLLANAVLPAVSITYAIISGNLPNGLTMDINGLIIGTPNTVANETISTFVVRATDNYANIRDRTFSITVSGEAVPEWITPAGSILTTLDSIWVELPLQYSNPIPSNPISVSLLGGELPPGLEVNSNGLIRGYAQPPTVDLNLPFVTTSCTVTSNSTNQITCASTSGFVIGRPIFFSGSVLGGISSGQTYYVNSILDSTTFTISLTQNGPIINLNNDIGFMTATLLATNLNQPVIRTYTFLLGINSPNGSDVRSFSIIVVNQNTPISQGGPGFLPNSRTPTIYNTRPPTFNINPNNPFYAYYLLPSANSIPNTYNPLTLAPMGVFPSDEYFSFKLIGHDFDFGTLTYEYADLPSGLTGDPNTGWITGIPSLSSPGVSDFIFSARAHKSNNENISTPFFYFTFKLVKTISPTITWISSTNLGTIDNGLPCTKKIVATADTSLEYRLISGSLPPNLTLLTNGEIIGTTAYQPTENLLQQGDTSDFTFTIQAFSTDYPAINDTKTFTLKVYQRFTQPTDTLYIQAALKPEDRNLIADLLNNETLIPAEMIYRPEDPNFGKASSVIYEHAYGIYASDIEQYLTAVTKNHYWRNITLGELATAVAKDETGQIIYEVVYSKVIDNLINPQGISVSKEIHWPYLIDLQKGPWYTSVTNVYTSWVNILGQPIYTSLTPGYARTLYPNSLPNMRNQVASVLGQEYNNNLLPLWMITRQPNGTTLGYTPAWVICYTKPGFSQTILNNINNNWKSPTGYNYRLNIINFEIDRFTVNKTITYNYNNFVSPPTWIALPSGTPEPDPKESKDFYVLFPRQNILPDETQY